MLKKWLSLSRNATCATLYHPKVLKSPQPTFQYKKASLSYLIAIETSSDHVVTELQPLLYSHAIQNRLGPHTECLDILQAGRQSASTIPSQKRSCKQGVEDLQSNQWNDHLVTHSVQCKFSNIVSLEDEQHLWSKLMTKGLPQGQFSFLLKVGSDTLPTALNLRWMWIHCGSWCKLCKSPRPTTAHILSSCPEALSQGRYTWRHDSVLKCIWSFPNGPILCNAKLYADLNGFRFDDSPPLTIPSSIVATSYRLIWWSFQRLRRKWNRSWNWCYRTTPLMA